MTRKFDLRQIMKSAWNNVKAYGKSLSEGLKMAWTNAKANLNRKVFTVTYQKWIDDCQPWEDSSVAAFRQFWADNAAQFEVIELTDLSCTYSPIRKVAVLI